MSIESKKRRRRARRAARWEFTANELRMAGREMSGVFDNALARTRASAESKLDLAAMAELIEGFAQRAPSTPQEAFGELAVRTGYVYAHSTTAASVRARLAEAGVTVLVNDRVEPGTLIAVESPAPPLTRLGWYGQFGGAR